MLLSREAESLLSQGPQSLPLVQSALRPEPTACKLRSKDSAIFFPSARYGGAALAGLLIRAGCWADSHAVAQDLHSIEGSYWHGILHRMEPDNFNAGYWFQRTGKHSIHTELHKRASTILEIGAPKHWRLKRTWDASLFVEWCDEARATGGQAEVIARQLQMTEWELLFRWCVEELP